MKNQTHAVLYGLGAVLLWSTVATAFKLSLRELTPVQMLLIACMASVVVMSAILTLQQRWHLVFRLSRGQYLQSIAMGLINPCLYYFLLFGAFDRLPAQEAQPLNYTWALVLAYLSVPFLGQRLRTADIVAGLICYSGVVVIATRGQVLSLTFSSPAGVALALGSTVVWASYWILATRDHRDPVVGLFLNFACGLPFIALACWLSGGYSPALGTGLYSAIYVGVFEMGIAFVLWSYAMKKAENTARISNLIFISPFLSLLFISIILGEAILDSTYVGLVLIVSGLWVQQQKVRGKMAGGVFMSRWHIYLVRTAAGALYTGITTDVERRLSEHQAGAPKGARSLRGKGPLSLAFSAAVGDRVQAARLEWQIKQWPRARKEALVRGDYSLPELSSNQSGATG